MRLSGKQPNQSGGTDTVDKIKNSSDINNNPTYYQSSFNPPKVASEDVASAQAELKEWKEQKDNYGRYYGAKDATLELKADCHGIARKSETTQIAIETNRIREADTKQVEELSKLYPKREEQNLRVQLAGVKANNKVRRKRQQYAALMQKWA